MITEYTTTTHDYTRPHTTTDDSTHPNDPPPMPTEKQVPPNANNNVQLDTIVELLADNVEVGKTSEVHPTSGRVIKDSEDGTIYLGDESQFLDVSASVGIESDNIRVGEAFVTRSPQTSSFNIRTTDSGYALYRGYTGEEVATDDNGSSAEVGALVQTAVDETDGNAIDIEFANAKYPDNGRNIYDWGTLVTFDNASVMLRGAGRNNSLIRQEAGANTTLIDFAGNGSILDVQNLKFSGNDGNNSNGTAIKVSSANELNLAHVEFRDWPNQGVLLEPTGSLQWNHFYDAWFLDNNRGLTISDNGGQLDELQINGGVLSGGDPEGNETGNPAIVSLSACQNIQLNGVRYKGGDVLDFQHGDNIQINGGQARSIGGNYFLRVGEAGNAMESVDVRGLQAQADSGSPVDHWFNVGASMTRFTARENTLLGAATGVSDTDAGATTVDISQNVTA